MNSNNPAFMPFPFPFGWQQPPAPPDADPPARVRVALAWLRDCTSKMAERAAVNDVSVQIIDGQALSVEEKHAQVAACNLLVDYFEGKLPLDCWEQADENNRRFLGQAATVLNCPNCCGELGKGTCKLCRGMGTMIAFPNVVGG